MSQSVGAVPEDVAPHHRGTRGIIYLKTSAGKIHWREKIHLLKDDWPRGAQNTVVTGVEKFTWVCPEARPGYAAHPFPPAHWLQYDGMSTDSDIPAVIRSFVPADQAACRALYEQGLVGGKISDNDTGFDIDNIEVAYMKEGNHFWVAEAEVLIVGTIGVQHHDEGTGEIRRLRVHPDYRRRGIGTALVETAVRFCREQNYLKVTLDTFMERDPAIRLFEQFKFRHYRTRTFGEKELVYFYLDLYAGDEREPHAPQAG